MNDRDTIQKRTRAILSWVLSFFLSMFLSLFILLVVVLSTVCSPAFLQDQVDQSRYVQYVQEDIENHFISYGMSSGFGEEFFSSVIETEALRTDIQNEFDRIYHGGSSVFDVKPFEDRLYGLLVQDAEERNLEVSGDSEEGLRYLAHICTQIYADRIEPPLISYLSSSLITLHRPALLVTLALAFMIFFVFTFLFIINTRRSSFLRYAIYALSGSLLTVAVPAAFFLMSGITQRLAIGSQSLYSLLVTYVRQTMLVAALCTAGVVIVLAVLALLLQKRQNRRHRRGKYYFILDVEDKKVRGGNPPSSKQ